MTFQSPMLQSRILHRSVIAALLGGLCFEPLLAQQVENDATLTLAPVTLGGDGSAETDGYALPSNRTAAGMDVAVKVEGERAYDLAREGEEMDLVARPLWVDSLEIIARPDADHLELEMVCGKGGYVRSIARDLGRVLGCLGHVHALRRIWSGPFDLDAAVGMEQIEALARSPEIDALLQPIELALADLPELPATPEGAARLRNGNPGMVIASGIEWGTLAWASHQGRALAIGHYRSGELHPNRVLNLP
jgi:tRNA pseudouridine55 synthase